ncbi:MAG: hypothetical protein ABWX96_17340 [Propionibacteriaceae bacterium]
MITLTGRRLIAECDVFADDVDPLMRYVMPKAPRIALDDQGKPMFHLVWYRRPVDQLTPEERKTRLGGGILTVSTDLTANDDEIAQIRKELAADFTLQGQVAGGLDEDELAAAIKIGAVPVKDGTVSIAVMAENPAPGAPAGEMVANLVGVGRVSASGVGRSSFMAKLTQDGAALLWEMVEKNLQPIRVEYDIKFDHRLNGVTMVVHCDVEKAFNATQTQWADLNDDARWSETHSGNSSHYSFSRDQSNTAGNILHKVASDAEAIDISIIPEAGADVISPEMITQLTQQANDMVTDFLASTFLEINNDFKELEEPTLETELAEQNGKKYGHHGIHYYKLKSTDTRVTGDLNYTLKTKAVLEGHLTPNDNLSHVTGGQDVEQFRTMVEIDPDFYKFLAVEVLCTADFDAEPVDLVRGELRYKQGDIDEVKDVIFSKGDAAPKEFATYLDGPNAREYEYDYEVFYRGTSQTLKRSGRSESDVLVLDTDALGILRVDLQVGVVDFNRIASVLVKLWQGSGSARKEAEFTLTQGHESASWVQVTAAAGTEPYHYQCIFFDKQGQRIETPEQTSSARTLVIEQPISESLEIAVIPAGSFGADGLISRVVVALRYIDKGNNNYTVDDIITLTGEADSKIWAVPLVDPKLRTYEYRVTVFYSDGVTREDTWQPTDKTILPVGDPFGMRVQILPYRLKLSGLYEFGTIHLSFKDQAAGIVAEKDLQITDFTQPLYWRFRLGAPERHTYSYQLSLFTKDGQQIDLPEVDASREVLTLAPPAA